MISKAFTFIWSKLRFKLFFRLVIYTSYRKIVLRDFLGISHDLSTNSDHLKSAMDWLCRSQDATGCGGCSASYGFEHGWAPPYPETTGYIISTFLRYSTYVKDKTYLERAIKMGEWEIDIQLPSGAVRGGSGINDYPIVFNTGMVILGWTDLFKTTNDERFLRAAKRASDWLCMNIDNDGKWSRYTYNNIPHAYHSRVAWSLFEVYSLTSESMYREAALKNIKWVLSLRKENGWIDEMGFSKGENPLLHTIVYTLRGMLECAAFLEGDLKMQTESTVFNAAEKIMLKYEKRKKHPNGLPDYLPSRFNNRWQSDSKFSCLTGNAQLAILWLKIYQLNNDARFVNSALKLIDHLKQLQDIRNPNPGIMGGIAGSYPVWGEYMEFSYPNWAAKFFADAVILQEEIMIDLMNAHHEARNSHNK